MNPSSCEPFPSYWSFIFVFVSSDSCVLIDGLVVGHEFILLIAALPLRVAFLLDEALGSDYLALEGDLHVVG